MTPDPLVVLDTTICSVALRRRAASISAAESRIRDEWYRLVRDDQALLLGAVRQELLTGIREGADFERIRDELRVFEDVVLDIEDYERAAVFANTCRRAGVQGSVVDFLVCSASIRYEAPIFTTDRDFERFATLLPVRLHSI